MLLFVRKAILVVFLSTAHAQRTSKSGLPRIFTCILLLSDQKILILHIVVDSQIEVIANKPVGRVSQQYLPQAVKILQLVKEKYRSGNKQFERN